MRGAVGGKLKGSLVLSVTALVALLLALPAVAEAAWSRPTIASPETTLADNPHVAVDPAGEAVAVWLRLEGTYSIEASTRPPGDEWSAPVTLSPPTNSSVEPTVAITPSGEAIAVWQRGNGAPTQLIQASTKTPGGSWSAPVNLSVGGQQAREPQIAVDAAGDATVVWERPDTSGSPIAQAATKPAGGTWGAPVSLSAPGKTTSSPSLAYDAAGDALAVWSLSTDTSPYFGLVVQASYKPAGGKWGAPASLSDSRFIALGPDAAFDPAGNATVVWQSGDREESPRQVKAATKPAGGSWGEPVTLSDPSVSSGGAEIAFDEAGNGTIIWGRGSSTDGDVVAESKPAGGSWSQPVQLSTPGEGAFQWNLAVNGAGDAIATWQREKGETSAIVAATRPAGGLWSVGQDISPTGSRIESSSLGIEPSGDGIAGWAYSRLNYSVLQTATFTAKPGGDEPPQISAVSLTPNLWGSSGGTSSIGVQATDDGTIARAFAVVTHSDGTTTEVPLAATGGSGYSGSYAVPFNIGGEAQTYSVGVYVEDDAGQIASAIDGQIRVEPKFTPNPGYLTLTPTVLRYGSLSIGAGASATHAFVMRNAGKEGSPTVTGVLESSDPQFSIVGAGAEGLAYSLAPGQERTIEVTFKPTVKGQQSAKLTLNRADARQGKATVSLFGWGVK